VPCPPPQTARGRPMTTARDRQIARSVRCGQRRHRTRRARTPPDSPAPPPEKPCPADTPRPAGQPRRPGSPQQPRTTTSPLPRPPPPSAATSPRLLPNLRLRPALLSCALDYATSSTVSRPAAIRITGLARGPNIWPPTRTTRQPVEVKVVPSRRRHHVRSDAGNWRQVGSHLLSQLLLLRSERSPISPVARGHACPDARRAAGRVIRP